jgi:hypothetical protein
VSVEGQFPVRSNPADLEDELRPLRDDIVTDLWRRVGAKSFVSGFREDLVALGLGIQKT